MTSLELIEPPSDCADEIGDLHRYWKSIYTGSGLPGRSDFDPADIPHLLPNIWLIDVVGRPMRFRFRLLGTAITSFTRRDNTGKWLEDVYDDFYNTGAYRRMRQCADDGQPLFQRGDVISNPEYGEMRAERIYLPLAADGSKVDIIVIMTNYLDDRPKTNAPTASF